MFLSALDVAQIVLTSGPPSPGASETEGPSPLDYLNFSIPPPIGRFNLGIFDILIIAMLSEGWRIRGGPLWIAEVPGLGGFAFVEILVLMNVTGGLPLIPFLTLGWLISEGVWRIRRQKRSSVPRSRRPSSGLQRRGDETDDLSEDIPGDPTHDLVDESTMDGEELERTDLAGLGQPAHAHARGFLGHGIRASRQVGRHRADD